MSARRIKNFPFNVRDVDQTADEITKKFTGVPGGFVQVGPKKYFLSKRYEDYAVDIYNFPLRSDDTFVITFPRSGTTLTQELVWLLKNDLDFARAQTSLFERFPFLEFPILFDPGFTERLLKEMKNDHDATEKIKAQIKAFYQNYGKLPSPRFFKSHLPLSLLPPALLETSKVVFVARNPMDVAVSCYHHSRLLKIHGYIGDFQTYWNYFMKGLVNRAPFFEWIKEAWDKRNHPNVLFLFYEDLVMDLPASILRVSEFFGKNYSEEQIRKLCEHLHIDNFKKNMFVNGHDFGFLLNANEKSFVRNGKAGGWRDYFDEEMTAQAQQWIADNLRDTDLRFPTV